MVAIPLVGVALAGENTIGAGRAGVTLDGVARLEVAFDLIGVVALVGLMKDVTFVGVRAEATRLGVILDGVARDETVLGVPLLGVALAVADLTGVPNLFGVLLALDTLDGVRDTLLAGLGSGISMSRSMAWSPSLFSSVLEASWI